MLDAKFLSVRVTKLRPGDHIADLCGHEFLQLWRLPTGERTLYLRDEQGDIRTCVWPGETIRICI